ncbi:CLUMA_CG020383, isoform A [Clunio marinus]|uniref:CLUMA_CG020383, isoform A n=1 Tax=Clunio marinus TaxID=568069 RepID=A0A1J1J5Y9_9DIPT|nr:CLUMA_CG020383, isoform A [Clunio marinus]
MVLDKLLIIRIVSQLKVKLKNNVEIIPAFIKGTIIKSLTTIFGEIGGQIELDLLSFKDNKGILRVTQSSDQLIPLSYCFIQK